MKNYNLYVMRHPTIKQSEMLLAGELSLKEMLDNSVIEIKPDNHETLYKYICRWSVCSQREFESDCFFLQRQIKDLLDRVPYFFRLTPEQIKRDTLLFWIDAFGYKGNKNKFIDILDSSGVSIAEVLTIEHDNDLSVLQAVFQHHINTKVDG